MNFLERIFGEHHEGDRIYMDYAAATPLRHEVWESMRPIYRDVFGNASGVHKEGQRARRLIEEAREKVARQLQIRTEDVIFTSGGTEANNLAIKGVIEAFRAEGVEYSDMEIITTTLEHPSLFDTCRALKASGVTVHEVSVNEDGLIVIAEFEKLLNEKTVLVATSLINSEIGVIQDTRKLKRLMKEKAPQAVLLVDGAQAPLWENCQLEKIGADILTLDAGKFYGPKGVGALARRHGVSLASVTEGGGQEAGLRPGTENPASVVGFNVAFTIAQENFERRREGVRELQKYFFEKVTKEIPEAIINGSVSERVANNINISIPGLDTEFAVVVLDEHSIAASTKSACSGAGGGESRVVKTISGDARPDKPGGQAARATSTLRFTLGETSNKQEIDTVIQVLKDHIEKMKKITISK